MKFSMTKIGAALLALIMCMGMFVSCGDDGITVDNVKKDPYGAIMDGYNGFVDALSEKYGDVFGVFEKIAEGTGTYNISVEAVADPELSFATPPTTFDITAVSDSVNGTYSGKATVGTMGVNTDISLWGDKNNIALSAPAILGAGNYGVKLDTLETDFAKSELFALISGGMSYEEFKAEMEAQMGMSIDDLMDMFSEENIMSGYEQYLKDAEAVMDGITPEVTEGKYTGVDAITVKYTLTADDIKKLSEVQVNMFENMFGKLLAWSGTDMDAIMDESMNTVDEMLADGMILTCYLKKDNGMLIGEAITIGDELSADLSFGADVAAMLDVSMEMDMNIDGENMKLTFDFDELTDEGKGGFVMVSSIEGTGVDEDLKPVTISVIRHDADGKYEVKLSSGDEEVVAVFGTLTYSADEFKLTVDSVASAEGEPADIGVEFSAKAGGTVEALPEYKNILTMSEEELSSFAGVLGMIGGSSDGYEDFEDYEFTIDDLYEGLTEDEIEEFNQDLADMGMTPEDYLAMLNG